MTESGFARCKPGPGRSCTPESLILAHQAAPPSGHKYSGDPTEATPDEDGGRGLRSPIYFEVAVEPLGPETGWAIERPTISWADGRRNTQSTPVKTC